MNVKQEYDAAWNNARQHFFDNDIFIDPYLKNLKQDIRVGPTVLIQLEGNIVEKFSNVISELKKFEPHQYYYPVSDLHVTVLDFVGASEDFVYDEGMIESYKSIVQKVCVNYKKFPITFDGIAATRSAIFIQGFAGEHLANLRSNIREQTRREGIVLQERVTGNFVHSCIVRFKEKLHNPEKVVQLIDQSRVLKLLMFQKFRWFFMTGITGTKRQKF